MEKYPQTIKHTFVIFSLLSDFAALALLGVHGG